MATTTDVVVAGGGHNSLVTAAYPAKYGLSYIDPDPVTHLAFPYGESLTMWRDLDRTCAEDAEWVSFDHPMHGYSYPVRGDGGAYRVDETQRLAVDRVVDYLGRHLGP